MSNVKKMTIRDRVIRYLEYRGYRVVKTKSNKYVCYAKGVYTLTDKDKTSEMRIVHYHIGKKGSVRVSSTGNVSQSSSTSERFMKFVEQWEKENKLA